MTLHTLWPLAGVHGFQGHCGPNICTENTCNFSNFGLFILLMILFPVHRGTPWVWVCQLWSASSFLINHNPALTHAVHPDSCTVRISSQEPKFLKLQWFFLKTKLFSGQVQLAWKCNHVCKPHLMFLTCKWRSMEDAIPYSKVHPTLGHRGEDKSHGPSDSLDEKSWKELHCITLVKAMGDCCQPSYNTDILKTRCCVRHLAWAANGDFRCQRNTAFQKGKRST